ncbi:hypothetical protein NQ315_001949 [Exocentrus adspersus]|uniref:Carboxylic ester hydrolase n=1 Tax=Exocentrus adspersus TaxID=1586481 RepID=A0AAV8WAX4_9CUCU|nr:hypothetical protein NQ315_001949 [Exocentrus adspersus]
MTYKLLILFTFSAINLYATNAAAADPTLVSLPEGQIRGHTLTSPNGNVYYAFQEIPYAAPPVGNLRFQAPAELERWQGVLNATKNTKVCYQGSSFKKVKGLEESEDCLYLNVYTPLEPGNREEIPLAVLVWIHGGSYRNGGGAIQLYNPELFIDHNVVVVTLNYRLGALGFLTTEDGVIPGNIGLKDQHAALKWIEKNIGLFGGDPLKITISGQSAGGSSAGLHIISPKNKALFRAAIIQSGATLSQRLRQDDARFYAFELGKSLDPNFTSDDSQDLLKLLQNASASEINRNKVTPVVGKERSIVDADGLIWLPVIESVQLEDAFLTGNFHDNIRRGQINQVPIVIGFNSEEETFFWKSDASIPEKRAKYLDGDLSNLIKHKFNMTKENKLTAGRRLREIYTNGTFQDDLGAVVKYFSDESYTTPIIRHAKLQSNYTDVFLYQFSYKGKLGGQIDVEVAGVRGVGHSENTPYLWGQRSEEPNDPEDETTRHRLLTLFSNFVKYLNPTPDKDKLLNNVTWENVAPNKLVYLNINNTLEMQENPKEYLDWERIIDVYAIPPLMNY